MLRTSNALLLAGTALLGLAIAAVTFLITDVLFGVAIGAVSATVAAGIVAWFWFGLPLSRKATDEVSGDRG